MSDELDVYDQIRDLVGKATDKPIDGLIIQSKWGEVNFSQSRYDLERLESLVGSLPDLPLEDLTKDTAESIRQALEPIINTIQSIDNFTVAQGEPSQIRDNIATQLSNQIDNLHRVLAQWLPYLLFQKGDVQRNIQNLSAAVENGRHILDEAKSKASNAEEELERIISAAREASASAGVAHFTKDFSEQAETNNKTANGWLATTIGMAILTLAAAAMFLYFGLDPEATLVQTVQFSTTKVVILGFLFASTLWCGRMYRAQKHQEVSNLHRAHALKTFQAFVQASDDPKVRDAILLETTHSIFTRTNSGYLSTNASETNIAQPKIVPLTPSEG